MKGLEISSIEYFVIAGYLLLTIVVGLVFRKFSANTDDYFKGGSKGTWWLVGTSAFMSSFTAWTFTGAAGMAYESGFSVMFLFLGSSLGYFMNFLFLAPWLRQMRVTTLPEAISLRFGEETRNFYALYEVPVRILYAAMSLYSLGIFCSAVFGYNINYIIISCGIVVLFYSATGGRWAVMATDFLQGLILIPLTIIIAWVCLDKIGGIGNLIQEIEVQGLTEEYSMINSPTLFAGAYTWGWVSAIFVKQFLVYNSLNAAPRYFSVKDGKAARKAALLACVLLLLGSVIWFLPPITARLLFHEQVMAIDISKPAEASYAIASISLMPVGLIGMIVVAILTATMSSMDTGLNTNVAILIKDIYPKLSRRLKWKPKLESELLQIGRLYTWFLGTLIILLALFFAKQDGIGIFEIMLDVGALLAVPIAIPLLWGVFFRRTPWWAALLSIGFAFIPSCFVFFDIPLSYIGFSQEFSDGFEWNYQQKLFSVFGAGTFGFLLSTLFAPAPDSDHRAMVDQFFKTMKTPIDFEKEVGEGNDLKQLSTIGRFGAVVSAFIALLLIIPNPVEGRLAILALALVTGVISALMIRAGGEPDRPS
jgi:SSS family transporter